MHKGSTTGHLFELQSLSCCGAAKGMHPTLVPRRPSSPAPTQPLRFGSRRCGPQNQPHSLPTLVRLGTKLVCQSGKHRAGRARPPLIPSPCCGREQRPRGVPHRLFPSVERPWPFCVASPAPTGLRGTWLRGSVWGPGPPHHCGGLPASACGGAGQHGAGAPWLRVMRCAAADGVTGTERWGSWGRHRWRDCAVL